MSESDPRSPIALRPHGPRERAADELRAEQAYGAARSRARHAWRYQLAIGAIVAVLLGVGVGVVVWHSEIRAVSIHTTGRKSQALPIGPLPTALTRKWTTTDRSAGGQPVIDDVVVTYSQHTVAGRDATTGDVRWSYSRSDRVICAVAAQDRTVVAIYAHDNICDEVTGLDAVSGARSWVRTLLSDGSPSTTVVSSRSGNILITTPDALELLEPSGGLDWWYDQPAAGCTIVNAVQGIAGVLIASRCGDGDKLSLRTLGAAKDRAWTVPLAGRAVLAADTTVSVLRPDGVTIDNLEPGTGKVASTVTLASAVKPLVRPAANYQSSGTSVEAIAVQSGSIAVNYSLSPQPLWQRPGALPTPVTGGLLASTADGVSLLGSATGQPVTTSSAAGVDPSDTVYALGAGALVSSSTGTAAYQ